MGESHMKLRLMNAFTSLTIAAMLVGCGDRKSTRLNSSHSQISYAVFCLQKKKTGAEIRTAKLTEWSLLSTHRSLPPAVCAQPNARRTRRDGCEATAALAARPAIDQLLRR